MLQRKDGATLFTIRQTTGWQKHTVRGFMAGAMKEAGYIVDSFKPEDGERTTHQQVALCPERPPGYGRGGRFAFVGRQVACWDNMPSHAAARARRPILARRLFRRGSQFLATSLSFSGNLGRLCDRASHI